MVPDRAGSPRASFVSMFARIRIFISAVQAIGAWTAYRYYQHRLGCFLGIPGRKTFQLQPKGARQPILLRGGTSSDSAVFRQIFIEQEYQSLFGMPDVKCILDLGANTGLASVAFLNRFPNAQVVAVEPDPDNY